MTSASSRAVDMDSSHDYLEKDSFAKPVVVDNINNLEVPKNKKCRPIRSLPYNGPPEPCMGMVFEELEDAMTWYKAYARR
ncbi:unnamed protein product [Ilex paraguariensis]|uniref:Uncharacterized protein n=1 Tax=Ilex paraguariensis TaxID=185542 RepID=A0ABC8S6X5_9AQUA